jgi:hypothetical protein
MREQPRRATDASEADAVAKATQRIRNGVDAIMAF